MVEEEYENDIIEEDEDDDFVDRALDNMLNDSVDSGAVVSKILHDNDDE